ncbi:MAG: hypothetical protein COB42_02965 [Sulfurimonas sp.]|nr:MAG: hypothetical protein COB42_02965 [Sulfurimonas sp.]
MKEAQIIIEEYGLNTDEKSVEFVLELLDKYGTVRNVLIEGLKPEYKYLKKLSKILAMLDGKSSYDLEAEEISTLMHSINFVVANDSEEKGEDYLLLLNTLDIRKTFNLSQMQIWVMNYLGGREFISEVNLQDANELIKKIIRAMEKYEYTSDMLPSTVIENKAIKDMKLIK